MQTALDPHPGFRTDIQALRGFAVLTVLFYHAKLSLFPAGYLGVDVFFVISGFLITSLIKGGIEGGRFSFAAFYFRRAKRLLPAAYVTFLATALLAPFFLTMPEMHDFLRQMVGAITFSANFVLHSQSGYFEGSSELKPLLHTWSLAVEEQYYFVLPALMVFTPRRFWLGGALLVLAASLALCLARPGEDSTFFLLPARGWELMIGSVGALLPRRNKPIDGLLKLAFWPALVVLLALPLIEPVRYHPGPDALLICLATLVLILRRHPLLSAGAPMRGMARIGDISYALYLVHWPLFAFLNNTWIGEAGHEQPLALRLGLVALSLLLAYLLNRHVEEPVRGMEIRRPRRMLLPTVAASIGLIATTGGLAFATASDKNYLQVRRANRGFGSACNFEGEFKPLPQCRDREQAAILVWGDSYAMHLVAGLRAEDGGATGVVQATQSSCGPLIGLAPLAPDEAGGLDERWAERCIRFNDSVLAHLAQARSIRTVVLSSQFERLVEPDGRVLDRPAGATAQPAAAGQDIALAHMKATIDAIRALGKRVVVVSPPPSGGFDVARCLERLERDLPALGMHDGCAIGLDAYRLDQDSVLAFLEALPRHAGVDVVALDRHLCRDGLCRTYADGTFLYRDEGHLSQSGSVLVARGMSLVAAIDERAR